MSSVRFKQISFLKFLSYFTLGLILLSTEASAFDSNLLKVYTDFQNQDLEYEADSFIDIDCDRFPNPPQKDSSNSGKRESEEENKEKDSDKNDCCKLSTEHSTYLESVIDPLNNFSISATGGLIDIPLYLLFHCWKSFLG